MPSLIYSSKSKELIVVNLDNITSIKLNPMRGQVISFIGPSPVLWEYDNENDMKDDFDKIMGIAKNLSDEGAGKLENFGSV